MKVETINLENMMHHNEPVTPFPLIGELKITFDGSVYHAKEELYDTNKDKTYAIDTIDLLSYISSNDKEIFYAIDEECMGQIVIKKHWNDYCYIDDIAVKNTARQKGVGRKLLQAAETWAKERNLKGFMLETQNNNLVACRFYFKTDFIIGSVDTELYKNFDCDEKAIFFYKHF